MRAVYHFLNVFVVVDATLYVWIDFRMASVTHSECSNAVVDAELQSYSFWARPFSPLSSVTWFLAPHADYRTACSWNTRRKSATRVFASSSVSEDYASTLEKHQFLSTGDRKRVASIASPALTPKPWNLHLGRPLSLVCTSCWLLW